LTQHIRFSHIDPHQSIVRASVLTRRPPVIFDAQIAFRCLQDRQLLPIDLLAKLPIKNLDHANIVVRTALGTCPAANASIVVDLDDTCRMFSPNRPGRTSDQTNGIRTMHAGVRDHVVANDGTRPQESGVAVMGVRAGSDAVVTARAAVQIDEHRLFAIDQPLLNNLLQPGLLFRHVRRTGM
jgi:hypothetical protein